MVASPRRSSVPDAYAFFTTFQRYRIPIRVVDDLMTALDDSTPMPRRVAIVRFWALYLRALGLGGVPEPPPVEKMTTETVREIAEKLVAYVARIIGVTEYGSQT